MRKSTASYLQRAKWYLIGFVLFFAPFALYPRLLNWLLNVRRNADIHATCLRMPIGNLLTGQVALHGIISVSFISFLLLAGSAFLFGPFFCGRLCAAGALPEYLGRWLPSKWKIDWYRLVNPVPVRYGFFVGYLLAPFAAGAVTCSFCNQAFMQRLVDSGKWGGLGVLGSTTIITGFLWLILFGIAARGGRGFCSFLCPIGALQSLLHAIGSKLGFTAKMRYEREKCSSCHACVKECPMGALGQAEEGVSYKVLNCLTCRQCEAVCPKGAITYGRGAAGWGRPGASRRKGVALGLTLLVLLTFAVAAFAASPQVYQFNLALDKVIDQIKDLKVNPFVKLSLRLKVTEALTDNAQAYPDKVVEPKEIGAVLRESVKRKNSVEKTVSTVYAVDLARKMELTSPQVEIVKRVLLTGQGNLRKEGIPQVYLDTVAKWGSYQMPECCL